MYALRKATAGAQALVVPSADEIFGSRPVRRPRLERKTDPVVGRRKLQAPMISVEQEVARQVSSAGQS